MNERTVAHSTFTITRRYDAPPDRVFAAWADAEVKRRWFAEEDGWTVEVYELDFRAGGRERWTGSGPHGVFSNETVFHDIVPDRRIVFSYAMQSGETRISVSLATVEFLADGDGATLAFTEQGAFLDGHDKPGDRESGWGGLLDALGRAIEATPAG